MDAPFALPAGAWLAVHAVGLLAAFFSRLALGKRGHVVAQAGLVASFFTITAQAIANSSDTLGVSMISSVTLGIMVVAAVCDFGRDGADPLLAHLIGGEE